MKCRKCNSIMMAAGGTVSGSRQYWKCLKCGDEIEDVFDIEIIEQKTIEAENKTDKK